MKCLKCQDKGFIEKNYGLIGILCDCDKAKEIAAVEGIPWGVDDGINVDDWVGVVDDSISGIKSDNKPIGSGDPGKPKQPKKQSIKKKAGKKSS